MIELVAKYMSLTSCKMSNVMNMYLLTLLINNSKTMKNSFMPRVLTTSRVLVIGDKKHQTH
jgi:hypothetical protein